MYWWVAHDMLGSVLFLRNLSPLIYPQYWNRLSTIGVYVLWQRNLGASSSVCLVFLGASFTWLIISRIILGWDILIWSSSSLSTITLRSSYILPLSSISNPYCLMYLIDWSVSSLQVLKKFHLQHNMKRWCGLGRRYNFKCLISKSWWWIPVDWGICYRFVLTISVHKYLYHFLFLFLCFW